MPAPRILICGSLAIDTIMVFPDRFARHILPNETHVLSVSFQIGEMRPECGGCAGNIAYNLKAAGIPVIFDPGQGLPLVSGAELVEMIDCADYVAVNDYEGRLLAERTGLTIEVIA